MENLSVLLALCAGNPSVAFRKGPVMQSFKIIFMNLLHGIQLETEFC